MWFSSFSSSSGRFKHKSLRLTVMHCQALPDADAAAPTRPEQVAARILAVLRDERVASGSRIEAQSWSAA